MAQHESFGFKNAADKAAYEADYAERAKDHQDEECRFIISDIDATLFQNVRHYVLIAGFKHSHKQKEKGAFRGRNITSAALAGYCGHVYNTELMDWLYEKRVVMVFKAFQAVEKARFDTNVIDLPHLLAKHVWAQLNNPENVDLIKRHSIEISVKDLESITDQAGMQTLISKLPDLCSRAQNAIDNVEGLTKTMKNARKKEISYVAMGIQLARFQQVLLQTSNGQRFFPGKAGLSGNPGCRLFEDFIEIEDLSRAFELFAFAKIRTEYKRNAEGERLNKAKDVLAERPYYYPPSIFADQDVVKAAVASSDGTAALELRDRWSETIITTEVEALNAASNFHLMVPASCSGIKADGSANGASTLSDISPVREHCAGSNEPTGKPQATDDDTHTFWSEQAHIEANKAKMRQKQSDIKKKVSSIKEARRYDERKMQGWQTKLEQIKQTLKKHDSDLEGLAEEDRQAYNELKRLDREAKMLVSDFDLAVIKRKREELEQDEERIKKRKQALVDED